MRLIVFLLLMTASCCFSCNETKSHSILPEEKMQSVIWQLIKADVYTVDFLQKDSNVNAPFKNAELQKSIFEKEKISKEQFQESYDFYIKHPELMKNIFDTILNRNSREKIRRFDTLKIIRNEQGSQKRKGSLN